MNEQQVVMPSPEELAQLHRVIDDVTTAVVAIFSLHSVTADQVQNILANTIGPLFCGLTVAANRIKTWEHLSAHTVSVIEKCTEAGTSEDLGMSSEDTIALVVRLVTHVAGMAQRITDEQEPSPVKH